MRFDEHIGTGRGMFFQPFISIADLDLKHGCHESVALIQLKSTINFKLHLIK